MVWYGVCFEGVQRTIERERQRETRLSSLWRKAIKSPTILNPSARAIKKNLFETSLVFESIFQYHAFRNYVFFRNSLRLLH